MTTIDPAQAVDEAALTAACEAFDPLTQRITSGDSAADYRAAMRRAILAYQSRTPAASPIPAAKAVTFELLQRALKFADHYAWCDYRAAKAVCNCGMRQFKNDVEAALAASPDARPWEKWDDDLEERSSPVTDPEELQRISEALKDDGKRVYSRTQSPADDVAIARGEGGFYAWWTAYNDRHGLQSNPVLYAAVRDAWRAAAQGADAGVPRDYSHLADLRSDETKAVDARVERAYRAGAASVATPPPKAVAEPVDDINGWWRVEVSDHAGQIVAIEQSRTDGVLCGRDIGEREECAINGAIGHLIGFLGSRADYPQPPRTDAARPVAAIDDAIRLRSALNAAAGWIEGFAGKDKARAILSRIEAALSAAPQGSDVPGEWVRLTVTHQDGRTAVGKVTQQYAEKALEMPPWED